MNGRTIPGAYFSVSVCFGWRMWLRKELSSLAEVSLYKPCGHLPCLRVRSVTFCSTQLTWRTWVVDGTHRDPVRHVCMAPCMVFGRWSQRSWQTGLLGVLKWRGVGVCLFVCLFVCLELQCDKVNCTYRGREKNYTRAGENFYGRCANCQ